MLRCAWVAATRVVVLTQAVIIVAHTAHEATEIPVGAKEFASIGWRVGTSHANVLKLGQKFRLSGVGDGKGNDEWLRLFDSKNSGFYGGFAAGKLWGSTTITTHLQLGNKWRLSADGETHWLRLAPSKGDGYFGGFAAGKLKTNNLAVEGPAVVKSLLVAKNFLFTKLHPSDTWLRLLDPLTKKPPTKGGVAVGKFRATEATVQKVTTNKVFLGPKWVLSGNGDSVKNDNWLRLMSADGKSLFGGYAAEKMWTQTVTVTKDAKLNRLACSAEAVFHGKATFKQRATFHEIVGTSARIGSVKLSNTAGKYDQTWLHVLQSNGKSLGNMRMDTQQARKMTTSVLHLGTKWRLSAVGDKFGNDDWLRLTNKENTGYYGGLAIKKIWAPKAFNHVLQLGTKWRLSGVGDGIKNDKWLRLMNVQNSRLYGGFQAQKLWTTQLKVEGTASVGTLNIKKKYTFISSPNYLQLRNHKKKLAGLEAQTVKAHGIMAKGSVSAGTFHARGTVTAQTMIVSKYLKVAGLRLGLAGTGKSSSWLHLTSSDASSMANLKLGKLKASSLTATGTTRLGAVHAHNWSARDGSLANLRISGKLHVNEGIWVGKQRIDGSIVPFSHDTTLRDELEALKKEVALLKMSLRQA